MGALFISGFTSQPSELFGNFVQLEVLRGLSLQRKIALLGSLAATFLIFKSVFSMYLSNRLMKFLAFQASQISKNMMRGLFTRDLKMKQGRSFQEVIYAMNNGVLVLVLEFLGSTLLLTADIFLTIAMLITLFTVDSAIAIWTLFYFGLVTLMLLAFTRQRIAKNAKARVTYEIESNEIVNSILDLFREIKLRGGNDFYIDKLATKRRQFGESLALGHLYSNSSKYVIEIALIVGTISLAFQQFITKPAIDATATVAVFLVASVRIAPAVLRITNGIMTIRATAGLVHPTLRLLNEYQAETTNVESYNNHHHNNVKIAIKASDLSYFYNEEKKGIHGVNFEVKHGTFLAIVGSSGAGKSTLADLIAGMQTPSSGQIEIFNAPARNFVSENPGVVGYVPQSVYLLNGSIRENLLLGYSGTNCTDDAMRQALKISQLSELSSSPSGLDKILGDKGNVLSGGQRQRLGLARALLTNPKILILDEATSALDGSTESDVTNAILTGYSDCTLVVIAHRLTTVKRAELILYLKDGEALSFGTIKQVRSGIEDFDKQLKLQGIQ